MAEELAKLGRIRGSLRVAAVLLIALGTCAPGSYDMAVGATHEGCQPVLQTFRHSARQPDTEMAIILVCEP